MDMSNPDPRPTSEAAEPEAAPSVEPAHDIGDNWLGRTLRTVFGFKAGSIRANLRTMLEKGAGAAGFSPKESAMLRSILSLRERRVADVMVPRADIIAVQKNIALGDLLKVFASQAHSRLVVYDDTLDDAIGMVHIRDLIALMTARAVVAAAEAGGEGGEPLSTGLDLKVIDLLAKMQATRIHLALVVDEYGGTDGVVSMEDIVEQIVGDIADEHDEDMAPGVVRQADGSYLANARASLEDATAIIGPEFDVGEVAQEVDTLAGYIATRIGRLPVRGEVVPGPGRFEIEVLDADPRRVKRLKIYQSPDRRGLARPRPAGPSVSPAAAPQEPSAAQPLTTDPPKA